MNPESTMTDHHDETVPASNAHAYPWETADTARAACNDLAVTTYADAAETQGFSYLRQAELLLSLLHANGFKREPLLLFQKPAR